jgi:hypothetical protein
MRDFMSSILKRENMRKEETTMGFDIDDNIIPVSDLMKVIWKNRLTFLTITSLTLIAGLGARAIFSEYKSEGFLQFGGTIPIVQKIDEKDKEPNPGITLTNYKRYAAAFKSNERFTDFLNQHKLEPNPFILSLSLMPRNYSKNQKAAVTMSSVCASATRIGIRRMPRQWSDYWDVIPWIRLST